MIVQGHNQPSKPAPSPHGPTPHHGPGGKPSGGHNKPAAPAKPSKPANHKPSGPSKPTKPSAPSKKSAARNEIDVELEWIDFKPLKGGYIH